MANSKSATTTANEGNKGIRNFKQNNDIESFYRFVYENGVRREASLILKKVYDAINTTKKRKARKKKSKKAVLQ